MNYKTQSEALSRRGTVPQYIENDLQVLEYYFQHDQNNYSSVILDFFARKENVYTYSLDLIYYSKDFMKWKTGSFSHLTIESLRKWCSKHDTAHLLTLEVKCLAVNRVLQQPNGTLVHLICDTFKVKDHSDYFKCLIKNILKENRFKEAYYLISYLNAEKDFTLEEFVFPAFFLDKDTWVKHYLEKSPDLQVEFLQKLDSICQHSGDIQTFIRSLPYDKLPYRKHVYDPNRLQKLLANYIEYFDVDKKECKNLYHARCGNAMSYIVRKRYKEESIGKEAFEEVIKFIINDNKILQKEFLMKILWYGDTRTALKFAADFNLDGNDLPDILQNISLHDIESEDASELPHDLNYLKLRLDRSDVILINTPEKCIEAVTDIAENYDVVGIDAEWRPNLGINKENLSVYQLAVWDTVYLLDVLALKQYSNKKFWSYVIEKIFKNKNILKLGYGFKNDLQLLSLCTDEKTEPSKFPCILDFCELFKKLDTCYPEIINAISETQHSDFSYYLPSKGLSQLCVTVLGKPLNKDEQFSDWEQRPLRESQVIYAALDAFCLLMMYEKLYHVIQDLKLNFDEVIKKTLNSPQKVENVKKKKEKITVVKQKSDYKPIPVSQFKVVVDNMLHGLGKYLRLCGADVAFLENDDDHMQAVQISNAENRIILSTGTPYQKLSGYVHEDLHYCVSVEENAIEQALAVLEHFNVQCTSSDIFSRCSVCSGNDFKKVPNKELYPLWCALTNKTNNKSAKEVAKQTFPVKEDFLSEDGILESGVPVQISVLTSRVFETVDYFFICTNCGKIYWEGSHFNRMKKTFSKLLDDKESSGMSIYQSVGSAGKNIVQNSTSTKNDSENKSESVFVNSTCTSSKTNFMSFDVDDLSDEEDINDIVYC